MDILRIKLTGTESTTFPDTEKIANFLATRVDHKILFNLLKETNKTWNWLFGDSNLRPDYHLKSLFVSWIEDLGIATNR